MRFPRLPRTVGLASTLILIGLIVRRWFTAGSLAEVAEQLKPDGDGEHTRKTNDPARARAEWTSLGISGAILLALIGTLTYLQLSGGDRPAVLEAQPRVAELRHEGERYYLPIAVSNRGGITAQDVRVEVSLGNEAGPAESVELLIDFLAGGATQQGVAIFRQDPRRSPLQASVVSYLEP